MIGQDNKNFQNGERGDSELTEIMANCFGLGLMQTSLRSVHYAYIKNILRVKNECQPNIIIECAVEVPIDSYDLQFCHDKSVHIAAVQHAMRVQETTSKPKSPVPRLTGCKIAIFCDYNFEDLEV